MIPSTNDELTLPMSNKDIINSTEAILAVENELSKNKEAEMKKVTFQFEPGGLPVSMDSDGNYQITLDDLLEG